MRRILIFGGTRFFGLRLVQRLLRRGDRVVVATRGHRPIPPGAEFVQADRDDPRAVAALVAGHPWDVIYDNLAFAPDHVAMLADALTRRPLRYVITSSMAVYSSFAGRRVEEDFDPGQVTPRPGTRADFSYAEGKRQVEAWGFRLSGVRVACARFPIVLGRDDYTRRLHRHVAMVGEKRPFAAACANKAACFISSEEAAAFLEWLGEREEGGAFNACASGPLTLKEVLGIIGDELGVEPRFQQDGEPSGFEPFIGWTLDNGKAARQGFAFSNLAEWLPSLVEAIVADEGGGEIGFPTDLP